MHSDFLDRESIFECRRIDPRFVFPSYILFLTPNSEVKPSQLFSESFDFSSDWVPITRKIGSYIKYLFWYITYGLDLKPWLGPPCGFIQLKRKYASFLKHAKKPKIVWGSFIKDVIDQGQASVGRTLIWDVFIYCHILLHGIDDWCAFTIFLL